SLARDRRAAWHPPCRAVVDPRGQLAHPQHHRAGRRARLQDLPRLRKTAGPCPMNGRLTVLLLAGSRGPEDPVARMTGVPAKALAPVNGRPMIDRVIDTLQRQTRIGAIRVVADRNPAAAPAFAQLAKRAGVEL